jgi:light-regulated signal transduction histidine kinase (bacteriophytochrome)/CheY-like chemotaxis protein
LADQDPFDVDLTNCDREPIHELGAVQPFGFLLALSTDWLIRRVSANADRFFGIAAEDLLGTSAIEILGEHAVHTLRNRLAMLRGPDAVERVFGLPVANGNSFDFALHMLDDMVIVEGEESESEPPADAGSAIRAMMARLDATGDDASFFREGARQVRALTGFDRVMVYRFDTDGSGLVAAEAARPGIGSFLDLRYPASDIPQQARKLYLRTPFRIIADVDDVPVPILPQRDERGAPLDLSLSVLRAVSPIHVEYLRNMGVGASLSISIIVEGQLWGLFACHHYAPRRPSFERRSLAELFGQMFALKLESRERKSLAAYESRARSASDRLLAAVAGDATLLDNPDWLAAMLRETIPCDGIAIWIDGKVAHSGLTPPPGTLPGIVRRLNAMAAGRIFATDRLADTLPRAVDFEDVAPGLLAIPISRSPRDYVLLFRQEKIRTVRWAGDPHKPAEYGPNGPRLTPRKSFESWSQEVRGRAEPFSQAETRVAEMLRASLIEVVLRLSDDAQEERRRFSERQELLIAELNHRVRNILALIRGLVRQSLDPETDTRDTIALLEGRIESMARAHDQITQDNWSAAPLSRLIETEAAAYLGGKSARLATDGPPLLLHPSAFSTLALVFHELMTNSAKYGALSDSGKVHVSWHLDEEGDLEIEWRERGGPAVQAPRRQGFGTTIIQRSIPYDLGGSAEIRYPLTGFEADFRLPARHIAPGEARRQAPPPPPIVRGEDPIPHQTVLSGIALLVEDSLIIAMDAEDILTRLGAARVVTTSNILQSAAEIARATFEIAVLDVNLGAETSLPIADLLREAGVPYVFATGYGEQLQLPPEHEGAEVIQKPYTMLSIAEALTRTLAR